jgi:hypothetical protein
METVLIQTINKFLSSKCVAALLLKVHIFLAEAVLIGKLLPVSSGPALEEK